MNLLTLTTPITQELTSAFHLTNNTPTYLYQEKRLFGHAKLRESFPNFLYNVYFRTKEKLHVGRVLLRQNKVRKSSRFYSLYTESVKSLL